ncbi:MAG: hypothetical protein IT383_00470 [Deltaproteobacteria bacterium]|nr:hypothetical protein [Deltaproteobacteria bacterium]
MDLEVEVADTKLALCFKANPTVAAVTQAADRLLAAAPRAVPLVVAPFMGFDARAALQVRGVAWLDLSGNVHIKAPRLLLHIEGKENKFKRSGRPQDVFAPRSARVARAMLHQHERWFTQNELAQVAHLSAMQVGRVVKRLVSDELLERNAKRAVRARDPRRLLEAWRPSYDFNKHHIVQVHRFARSGEELTGAIHEILSDLRIEHAFTGLAAAWLFRPVAAYRTSSVYVSRMLTDDELEHAGLRREESGGNLLLVAPNDDDIMREEYCWEVEGTKCVSQVQAWLDLHAHPERAKEAAAELLEHDMPWNRKAKA